MHMVQYKKSTCGKLKEFNNQKKITRLLEAIMEDSINKMRVGKELN